MRRAGDLCQGPGQRGVFDINRNFARKPFDVFRARIGQGYHCTESACTGISASFTLLVPKEDFVEMHRILLRNDGEEVRRLSLYAYVQPFVNLTGVDACGRAEFREDLRGIYYTYRAFRQNNPYTDVFYAADQAADAYELTADAFFGRYGTLQNPEGLSADRLSAKQTVFEPRYAAVLQFDIELAPREEKAFILPRERRGRRMNASAWPESMPTVRHLNGKCWRKGKLRTLMRTDYRFLFRTAISTG